MDRSSAPFLSDDQLREPPTVHLATGMVAAALGVSCAEAFDRLHQQALEDGSLVDAAEKVIRREMCAPGDGDGSARSRSDRRSFTAGPARWAVRNTDTHATGLPLMTVERIHPLGE